MSPTPSATPPSSLSPPRASRPSFLAPAPYAPAVPRPFSAGIDSDHIQLLGRWQSDVMFRYLRIQAATGDLSQKMLDHGGYSFAPGTYSQPNALPQQVPVSVHDLLAHDKITE